MVVPEIKLGFCDDLFYELLQLILGYSAIYGQLLFFFSAHGRLDQGGSEMNIRTPDTGDTMGTQYMHLHSL